jgi:triosephosphate isomerase (TIM)
MTRRKVVAGNWKMNHGPAETRAFLEQLTLPAGHEGPRVLCFPPALSFAVAVASPHRPARLELGVQNLHWAASGAFTGEVSAAMAREAGATLALVGHSERRHVFGESDADVSRKVEAAVAAGLEPVICVGETLEERRAGRVEEVIVRQLDAALEDLPTGGDFILAYEPVWAIGTGETATPQDASSAHGALRARLAALMGTAADAVPILYGGSVQPGNAAELMSVPDVDGVLVGGASLDSRSFAAIVEAA